MPGFATACRGCRWPPSGSTEAGRPYSTGRRALLNGKAGPTQREGGPNSTGRRAQLNGFGLGGGVDQSQWGGDSGGRQAGRFQKSPRGQIGVAVSARGAGVRRGDHRLGDRLGLPRLHSDRLRWQRSCRDPERLVVARRRHVRRGLVPVCRALAGFPVDPGSGSHLAPRTGHQSRWRVRPQTSPDQSPRRAGRAERGTLCLSPASGANTSAGATSTHRRLRRRDRPLPLDEPPGISAA